MKRAPLIMSGHADKYFAKRVISALWETENPVMFAAADGGLRTFDMLGLRPALLVGDFDTVEAEILVRYLDCPDIEVQRHNPVKDDSDLALAIGALAEKGCAEIHVLGALGGRAGHSLANMHLCYAYKERGVSLYLLDEQNHIHYALATERHFSLRQDRQWRKYLGFFSIGGTMEIKSLRGVHYPLTDFSLSDETALILTMNNEINTDSTKLELSGDPVAGLLLIEGCDREESKWIRSQTGLRQP